jgi:large subunit ribosomal protein L4
MKSAFSTKMADTKIVVVEGLNFDTMKTKNMVDFMKAIKVSDSALVVLDGKNENVEKSARNLPTVKTAFVNTINVFDILKYDSFIMTKEAAEKIMEVYV